MSGAFSRSWKITKLSFNVMKKDKELLLFPLFGAIFSILFMIALLFPTIVIALITQTKNINSFSIFEYVILFLTYFGLTFIAVFFNVCVVYTTKKRFEGGNATFFESIKFAFSKTHLIFMWSLVSATVGIILRLIDQLAEKAGKVGRIILLILNAILGLMWSIITIFVVPAMVYNDLGPIDAIKKSIHTLKKTWGESLIRHFGLGLVQFLFIFIGIIISIPLVMVSLNIGTIAVIVVASLLVIYFIAVILIFNVANTIFNTALYVYADQGKIPEGYDKEIMNNAFRSRKNARI